MLAGAGYCQQRCYKCLAGDSEGLGVVERANTNRSRVRDLQYQWNVVKIVSITGPEKARSKESARRDTPIMWEPHQRPPGFR